MRIDAASTASQQTPSTKLGIVETLPGTKLETETHPTPSSLPGIVVTSLEIHLTLSAPETHLSISISPEVVFEVSGGASCLRTFGIWFWEEYNLSDFRRISPKHPRNNGKRKSVGKFCYLKYLSRGVHLRNTPRIYLANPTLDAGI